MQTLANLLLPRVFQFGDEIHDAVDLLRHRRRRGPVDRQRLHALEDGHQGDGDTAECVEREDERDEAVAGHEECVGDGRDVCRGKHVTIDTASSQARRALMTRKKALASFSPEICCVCPASSISQTTAASSCAHRPMRWGQLLGGET